MGCNGSRLSIFKKPIKYGPEVHPNMNPITSEEQPDSLYHTRSKSTTELPSIRKVEGDSLRRVQSFGYYEKSDWTGRSPNGSIVDQKRTKRLLERQKSERQAMEAFRADAALNEVITLPQFREITQINDKLTRPSTDATPGMIDPYNRQSQGHILQPFSQPMTGKVKAVQGVYDQYDYVPPMLWNKNTYEHDGFMNNRYETGYAVPNSYEPWRYMQPVGNNTLVTIPQAYDPRNGPMTSPSFSYVSQGTSGHIVMGQKPEVEDPISQHRIINNEENAIASTQLDTEILFSGHKDDPFDTSENSEKKKTNPSSTETSGRQASNTGFGMDDLAVKNKESKSSKYGEPSTEFDMPNMENELLGLGPRMSDMLEGMLSVESSSSTNEDMGEGGFKTKEAEEPNWEELVKGINASVSTSSSSSELNENVNTTKKGPIYETNWQSNEQPAGF